MYEYIVLSETKDNDIKEFVLYLLATTNCTEVPPIDFSVKLKKKLKSYAFQQKGLQLQHNGSVI